MKAWLFAIWVSLVVTFDAWVSSGSAVDVRSAIGFCFLGASNVIAIWVGWRLSGVIAERFSSKQ